MKILAVLPGVGNPYPEAGIAWLRRLYLETVAHHRYYTFDDEQVIVRAFWGGRRGRGPVLRSSKSKCGSNLKSIKSAERLAMTSAGRDARAARRGVWSIALLDSRPEWYIARVTFTIEIEREVDGRWLAEVPALSGVMAYGQDRDEAVARVQALALRVIAERLEHREAPAEFLNVTFQAA
ncbi:MAG: type II toxin-antitoxin system HicB family antitoxin [Acidobacteriota bacterium]